MYITLQWKRFQHNFNYLARPAANWAAKYHLSALGLINDFVSRYTWYDWAAVAERCSQNDRTAMQHTDTMLLVPLIKACGKNWDTTYQTCSKRRVLSTVLQQKKKKKKEKTEWAKQESLNSEHRDNNFWRNKLARKKMARWILKPQLLRAVLLPFPLVSCTSTAISFPGPLSSSAVLDVNFSERIS